MIFNFLAWLNALFFENCKISKKISKFVKKIRIFQKKETVP